MRRKVKSYLERKVCITIALSRPHMQGVEHGQVKPSRACLLLVEVAEHGAGISLKAEQWSKMKKGLNALEAAISAE